MAGFASVDQIVNAISVNGYLQRLQFIKHVPSTNVANVWHTMWKGAGNPAAGGDPTLGTGGAVVVTDATQGAMPYTNSSGGRTMHILGATAMNPIGVASFLLVDRIAHMRLARNQATASFSPNLDATSRLASGEGGQLIMEVSTALGSTVTDRTFTYTNEAGTGSRVTPSVFDTASAVVGRSPAALSSGGGNILFLPLQAGDKGVRSVQSTTLGGTGTATGEYHLSIVRPLLWIPLVGACLGQERDLVVEIPSMPRLYDDSALVCYFVSPSASSSFVLQGEIRICEN